MSKNTYNYKTINGKKNRLHRHLMEEFIGRPLESFEHVYHVNGDSTDNRIENLIIIQKNLRK
jgi:hypothetical protein